MFIHDYQLTAVELSFADNSGVAGSAEMMFCSDEKLKTIILDNFDTSSITNRECQVKCVSF